MTISQLFDKLEEARSANDLQTFYLLLCELETRGVFVAYDYEMVAKKGED